MRTNDTTFAEGGEARPIAACRRVAPAILTALISLAAAFALPAGAAEQHHTVVAVEELSWKAGPPTLPFGAQFAVLLGSPAEAGPFVLRLKLPAGYNIPPHWHSKEEHVTVIAGAFGMGTGEVHDRGKARLLAAGSFVAIPAQTPHFAWTEQETVVQINGMGPFDINYVDPEDDPRTQ